MEKGQDFAGKVHRRGYTSIKPTKNVLNPLVNRDVWFYNSSNMLFPTINEEMSSSFYVLQEMGTYVFYNGGHLKGNMVVEWKRLVFNTCAFSYNCTWNNVKYSIYFL